MLVLLDAPIGAALQRAPTLDVHKYHKEMIITVGFARRKGTYNGIAISDNRLLSFNGSGFSIEA
jgi:hypothetical protein